MTAVRKSELINHPFRDKQKRDSVEIIYEGKPFSDAQPENITRVTVEEKVEEWNDTPHIFRWFIENVMGGKEDYQTHPVSWSSLQELLSVCEKVLYASHLVPAKAYAGKDHDLRNVDRAALSAPARVIKNVAVAHNLMPVGRPRYGEGGDYDEAYLKVIEETRTWVTLMLKDQQEGVRGDIYISLGYRY